MLENSLNITKLALFIQKLSELAYLGLECFILNFLKKNPTESLLQKLKNFERRMFAQTAETIFTN